MGRIDHAEEWGQIATPADPASGYTKPYFKSDGKLYAKSGSTEQLIGPGGSAAQIQNWVQGTSYVPGDIAGYAGRLWKCTVAGSNKVPLYYTNYWTPVLGTDRQLWHISDPDMNAAQPSDVLETFWKTGTSTCTMTNTSGEYETGNRGLKVALSSSSSQRLYDRHENNIRDGELILVKVRAKASAAANIEAQLLQNVFDDPPDPLATGLTAGASLEGIQALTTSFATYYFTFVAVAGKPRAKINLIPQTGGNSANVFIDRIEIVRGSSGPRPYSALWNTGTFSDYVAPTWSPCTYRREGTRIISEGLMAVGGFGWAANTNMLTVAPLPTWARPSRNVIQSVNSSTLGAYAGRFDINVDGTMAQQHGTMASGSYISLSMEWTVASQLV